MRGHSSTEHGSHFRVQPLARIAATALLTADPGTLRLSISVSPVDCGELMVGSCQLSGFPKVDATATFEARAELLSSIGLRTTFCETPQPDLQSFLKGTPFHIHLKKGLLKIFEALRFLDKSSKVLLKPQTCEEWDFFHLIPLTKLEMGHEMDFLRLTLRTLTRTRGVEACHSKAIVNRELKETYQDYLKVIAGDQASNWQAALEQLRRAAHAETRAPGELDDM